MGTLIRTWKTIPVPAGATVTKNFVTWTVNGKKRTGKLSNNGRVSIQSDTWTAQFTDETGKIRRVSTKTTHRNVAEKILAQYEKEIDRIKSGVITRDELDKAQIQHTPLDDLLEQFRTKMIADGRTMSHIKNTIRQITALFHTCGIERLAAIRREPVERWIADEIQRKKRAAGTINAFITAVKAFVQYLTDTGVFSSNPLKSIRLLNMELDRRKIRRAMTKDEIDRLLKTTASGKEMQGMQGENFLSTLPLIPLERTTFNQERIKCIITKCTRRSNECT